MFSKPHVALHPTFRHRRLSVYIAGPMTSIPHFNFPAFDRAAVILAGAGYRVYNPAAHDRELGVTTPDPDGNPDGPTSLSPDFLHAAFRWDLAHVLVVDAVVVLPGWKDSVGATLEVAVAEKIGTPVVPLLDMPPADMWARGIR